MELFSRIGIKKIIASLLAVALVISGITFVTPDVSAAEEPAIKDVYGLEYNGYPVVRGYTSFADTEGIKRLSYCYSDGYFSVSPTVTNEHLATTSMMLAEFACRDFRGTDLFRNMGFENCEYRDYDIEPTEDTIGAGIASKSLFAGTEKECTLIVLGIRGGAYYAEWASNFDLGTSGDAEGFNMASEKLITFIDEYIENNHLDRGRLKFWLTGFSRAGGISNLTSKKLSDKYGKEQVYGYTFEAPQSANRISALFKKYRNIKNYRNYNDMIPFLYPTRIGMGLYGDVIEFANERSKNYASLEAKMLKQYELIKPPEDEYISPTNFRKATIRLDLGGIIHFIKTKNLVRIGKRISMHNFFNLLSLRSRAVMPSRTAYVCNIPSVVEAAASRLGVKAATVQDALRCLGKTYFASNEEALFENFTHIQFTKDDTVPLLMALNYIVLGNNEKAFPQICEYVWNKIGQSEGDYIGITEIFPAEEEEIKSALPTLLYALTQYIQADYFRYTQTLGTYLFNQDLIKQTHDMKLSYCWLRAYDSYYDDATMKAIPTYSYIETEIYAEDGDSLEGTTIIVRDNSGQELAVLKDGEVMSAVEQAVYVASTRDKNGRIRECAIHTDVSTKNTITITANGSAEPKKLHLVRRNLFAGTTFCDAPITDMQGKNNDRTDITLYENQEAIIHIAKNSTTAEKTVEIDTVATINGEVSDSEIVDCQYDGNNKQKKQGKLVLSCDVPECECLAWLINDELVDHGAEINYVVDLNSPNLIIHLQAEKEHTWENDECISCGLNSNMEVATVKYHACGGDKAPEDQTLTYSEAASISTEVPTREGYVFAGWSTSENTEIVSYRPGQTIKRKNSKPHGLELYAVWKAEGIGSEYQRVEYIESTGTQYIDLGFSTTEGMLVDMDAMWTSATICGYIIGSHGLEYPYGRNGGYLDCSRGFWELGYGETCPQFNMTQEELNAALNKRSHVVFSTISGNAFLVVDGVMLLSSNSIQNTSDTNVMLFSNEYSLRNGACVPGRLYSAVITDSNGRKIRELVPCVRRADGVAGVFDKVERKFYTNDGSDEFKVGNPIRDEAEALPDQYYRLDYVETTGTQYIDTGFIPGENSGIDISFALGSVEDNECFIFGAGGSGHNDNAFELYPWNHKYQVNRGSSYLFLADGNVGEANTEKTRLKIDGEEYSMWDEDGVIFAAGTFESSSVNPSKSLTLFALNRTGGIIQSPSGRIYDCTLYQNGVAVRRLIPCAAKQNGEVGMYDCIEGKFYSCRGKGSLVGDGAVPDIFSLIVDEDGNGYNALTGEELQSGGSVTAEKDIIGYTAVFDGNSYFKYVPIRNKFEKMKEGYTVEFYGSIDELNANTYTCFFSTAENGGMGIEVGVNGKASFYNYLDGKYVHTDRTALDLHRLYHLVGVYDGSSMQFWINGRKFSDIDVTGELSFPENEISQYLCLGGDVNATGTAEYRFKGSIKTANIYSYPLTDKQIEKLYSNYTL